MRDVDVVDIVPEIDKLVLGKALQKRILKF